MTNLPTGSPFSIANWPDRVQSPRSRPGRKQEYSTFGAVEILCIVSSNLDEFFEVRVAGLKEQIKLDTPGFGPDGMLPHQVFKRVSEQTHALVARQYQLLNQEILPGLAMRASVFFAVQPGMSFSASGSRHFSFVN